MTHMQIRFNYGCTGKYCSPTIYTFSLCSGFFNEYLLNPTFLGIWNDNVAMPTFLTYSNANTYILQEPLGTLNSSNHAVLAVNLSYTEPMTIPINVTCFGGFSNVAYTATEVFSGTMLATFTNAFDYVAGTNSCTLMTVYPVSSVLTTSTQVLNGIQQIELPTPSGYSSSIVQNSLLTTGIGPNLVISGFEGLELDGQDYGVTVNDNFTVAPGFAITGTILAADIPAGISNAAYATNAGKAGLATNVVPGINTTNETANNITIVSGTVPASTLANIISSNNLPSDLRPLTVDNGGGLTNMLSASVSGRAAQTAISGGSVEYFSLTGNTNSSGIASVSVQTACPFGSYISNINFASCYAAPGQGATTNLVLRFVTNGVIDNGYSLVITGSTTGFLFASDTSSSVSISGITNLFIAVSNTGAGPTSPTLTWNAGFYK
jgi:hypothetical protein